MSGWLGVAYLGALAAVLVAFALVGACFSVTRFRSVQRCIDRHAERSARARRDAQREHAMHHASGLRRAQYSTLRSLVGDIETWDLLEARRFELQELLLDHFVQLSVAHQRCVDSLRASGAVAVAPLPSDAPPADPVCARGRRCADVAARRTRHQAVCTDHLAQVADELDAVDELVRLIAQRVACAKFAPIADGAIERRLAELDDVDEALTQLSA